MVSVRAPDHRVRSTTTEVMSTAAPRPFSIDLKHPLAARRPASSLPMAALILLMERSPKFSIPERPLPAKKSEPKQS
eukprot:g27294.t1